jgi:lysozyme family protein
MRYSEAAMWSCSRSFWRLQQGNTNGVDDDTLQSWRYLNGVSDGRLGGKIVDGLVFMVDFLGGHVSATSSFCSEDVLDILS